ncbi:chitinase [Sodiomyces alkalinus F11]|uniref:chitinase n=1 Tax=Sodiomyces alkalinus (strain CBS 110278 / VKM F-3762 / F11) TaxID=1314773 RepID=A0A3N2QA77_SODAK|nr:chitinase [Sodiomyces alkalinus F11]ROT43651.1 chitinase [Sodiomyces alkalinus F11]
MSSSSTSRRTRRGKSISKLAYTNAVYFPNERIYQGDTPGALNYGYTNHVYYAFANVSPDGGVFLSDEWADAGAPVDGVQGGLGSLMHLKQRHPHLQVLLSIGGGRSSAVFPVVAGSTLCRDNFARSAKGLVEASGLDGIDIVWEYPCDPQQGLDFLALLATVRLHLPEDQYLLTAALPANRGILQYIPLQSSAEYVDYINLMAYDFFGPWMSKSGHHSQLYAMQKDEESGANAVQYILSQGFPSMKILFGIPLYGRSFLGASGPGQNFKGAGGDQTGTFEYKSLPLDGAKEVVDKKAIAAQCVGATGGFVTYDNPDTVKTKAQFCKQKGLGGLFYWNGPADGKGSRSLVAAGFQALHSS